MTSELIYEGLGEVMAVENKIVVTTGTDSINTEKMQFFSQEMTDDAVAEFIFDSCDVDRSGKVPVSVLTDFLLKHCGGETEENREIFHGLLIMLDPQQLDPQITSETFKTGLETWISQIISDTEETETASVFSNLRFSKIESEQSDSGNSLCTSQPSSEISSDVQSDELQFQHLKLQELHKKLQTQLAEVDENNIRLQNDNFNLQTKILNIEMELKEKTEELKQLQDDNSFLHHDLEDKRENIQKLLQRYQSCEKELADQNRELDTLQKQFTSEKEIIKQLEDKIQHLEEVIHTRETELEDKEKDIHLLTLQLNEHQSTLDQSLASAERRISLAPSVFEATSLASELNCASPNMAVSWKKPKEKIKEQGYILPWNAMFNEPEFEDELSQETISFSRGQTPVAGSGVQVLHETKSADSLSSSASSDSLSPKNYRGNMISTPKTGRPHVNFELSGVGSTVHTMDSPSHSQYKDIDVTPQASMNLFKKICVAILFVFIVLFAATMTGVWYLLLLSMIDAGDCSSFGGYPCSPWTKVINLLKPYCNMEHTGLPPV